MNEPAIPSSATRHAVARFIAKYFLLHLHAEVVKPEEVLQEDHPELPVRQLTQELIERVHEEFAIPKSEALPTYNLFKRWCEINGMFAYEEAAFFRYNRFFIPRLLDLRDGTPSSQEFYFRTMREGFDSFDYEKQGFTVSFFLRSESIMRELLRDVIREKLPDPNEMADLVLAQSQTFQSAMYDYFEGVLKTALAENVRLLNGILPHQIANELKRTGRVEPVLYKDAAVIFTDFEGFSQATAHLSPAEVIRRLDTYFTEFDRIIAEHGLEKIKTIGDAYMAVAGVPDAHPSPVHAACNAALDINDACHRISRLPGEQKWRIRIGIHAGPLVAGVIGRQKFSYDVWGATVNLASRMEAGSEPGRINVSAAVHSRVASYYNWEARGAQPVKRLGSAEMYFLLGKKTFFLPSPDGELEFQLSSSNIQPPLR
jgi:class 3 adenylate cyclase